MTALRKYRAQHDILLPDGKTKIKAGEEFETAQEFFNDGIAVDLGPVTVEEGEDEAYIRAKGKDLKIPAAHNMGIKKLKAKIAEIEAAAKDGDEVEVAKNDNPAPEGQADVQN